MKRSWLISTTVLAVVVTAGATTAYLLNPKSHEQRCNDLRQSAFLLQQSGKSQQAEALYNSALAESRQSDNALQTVLVLSELAQIYATEHKDDAQEQTLRELLKTYEKLKAVKIDGASNRAYVNHGYIEVTTRLASFLQSRGRNQEALPLYKVALAANPEDIGTIEAQLRLKSEYAASLKALGMNDQAEQIEKALTLENEGYDWKESLRQAKGDYSKGRFLQAKKTFELCRTKALMLKDQVALSLVDSWLAQSYLLEGKTELAESLMRESVGLRQVDRNSCAYRQVILACVLQREGKLPEASTVLKQAYGTDPSLILRAGDELLEGYDLSGMTTVGYDQMKWLCEQVQAMPGVQPKYIVELEARAAEQAFVCKRIAESYSLLRKALVLRAPGADNARLYSDMAKSLDEQKRYKEAEFYWRKLLTQKLSDDVRVQSMDCLALNLQSQKRTAEALGIEDQRQALAAQKFGPDNKFVASGLAARASLYDAMNEPAKAETCWRQAIDIGLKAKDREPPYINLLYYRLADNQTHQLKLQQAEETLKAKLAYCKSAFGEADRNTILSYFTLAVNQGYQKKKRGTRQLLSASARHYENAQSHENVRL